MTSADRIDNILANIHMLSEQQLVALENITDSMMPLSLEVDFQFTPEMLESLERSRADVAAGRVLTIDEFDAHTRSFIDKLYA